MMPLWCAAQHLDSYEEALWLTASDLGDVNTTCAMVGGIYPVQTVGAGRHRAYWFPTEDLAEFNRNIVGWIEVVAVYRRRLPSP